MKIDLRYVKYIAAIAALISVTGTAIVSFIITFFSLMYFLFTFQGSSVLMYSSLVLLVSSVLLYIDNKAD